MPHVVEDILTVFDTPLGPAVGIVTIHGVKFAPGVTLAQGLNAMNGQIIDSAAEVTRLAEKVAAMESWLTTHLDYRPPPASPTPGTYLSPLFAALSQVPGQVEQAHDPEGV